MKNVLVILLLFCLSSCSNRTPNEIFKAVFPEIPASAKVLHSQDQYFSDCCIWLHFSLSTSDFEKISKGYTAAELDYNQWTNVFPGGALDWWQPSSFEKEGIYLEKKSEDGRLIEGIYCNAARTEVYYVSWYN